MSHLLLVFLVQPGPETAAEARNKTQNNSVMDETETPDNHHFRDPESDC